MKLALATDSMAAWSQLYEAISRARESVYMEMYAFSDDTGATHDFVGLLEAKAKQGVNILMVLDVLGSWNLSVHTIRRLRRAGVDIRFFRHWIHRMHRKMTIVDNRKAFLGGVNIGLMFAKWNDLQMSLSGPMVAHLVNGFERTYRLAGGKRHVATFSKKRSYKTRLWFVEHAPAYGKRRLRKYYQRKIENAKKSIILVTPYFIPGKWLETALANAVAKDVKVELHMPRRSDMRFVDHISRYYAARAVNYGARVYLSPVMNHAKAMLIDDSEGLIGSGNLDPTSFKLNNEIGVFFSDEHAIARLREAIVNWSAESSPFEDVTYEFRWWQAILTYFLRILSPAF